jgi:hypothetical protein
MEEKQEEAAQRQLVAEKEAEATLGAVSQSHSSH